MAVAPPERIDPAFRIAAAPAPVIGSMHGGQSIQTATIYAGSQGNGGCGAGPGALGNVTYAQRCSRCHALAAADFSWTPETLDRWLTNPQAMMPGARMYFRVTKPAEHAAIIAWLAAR